MWSNVTTDSSHWTTHGINEWILPNMNWIIFSIFVRLKEWSFAQSGKVSQIWSHCYYLLETSLKGSKLNLNRYLANKIDWQIIFSAYRKVVKPQIGPKPWDPSNEFSHKLIGTVSDWYEHGPFGEVSLYSLSQFLQVWSQLLGYIQKITYFICWSNHVLLNWRPADASPNGVLWQMWLIALFKVNWWIQIFTQR